MYTESFFDILLNLREGWVVESVRTDIVQDEIHINIKCISNKIEYDDKEGLCEVYDFAPLRSWRHLDALQYKTYISCRLPRIKTSNGSVKTIQPEWASNHDRHTFFFESAIINLLKATRNQTKTAELMRCGFNVVNRIIHRSVERGMKRRDHKTLTFENLSVDEKSFKKGHKYITVLSDPDSGFILDVEGDRTKESFKKLMDKTLTPTQQQGVKTVSMDMWKAFMNTAKEILPQASIVHDCFYLVKYLNDAIDKVRQREVKNNEVLINSRYALLKNPENLTEKQQLKFEAIRNANFEVSEAWQVRENFKDLFSSNKQNGTSLFAHWVMDAVNQNVKEVTKVVKMFTNHISGVVNALIMNQSNAMAERLNGKIQELKTIGRGYRTFNNFRSAILFFNGGLDLYH